MSGHLTLAVKYDCHACGLKGQVVNVKARGAEDVVSWTKAIMYELGFDHGMRSPNCPERKLDVWIPIRDDAAGTEAPRIGDPLEPAGGAPPPTGDSK